MPGADRLADHHLRAQFPDHIQVDVRLPAVHIQVGALHPGQHRSGIEGAHPVPVVEDHIVVEAGQELGGLLGAVRVIGRQVGGAEKLFQSLPEVLVSLYQVIVGTVNAGGPAGHVAGRVKAGDRSHQVGMAGGGGYHHLSPHALSDQDGFLQAQLPDEFTHVVAVVRHGPGFRLVAFAVAAQVDLDAAVIGGEVLLLEVEAAPASETAVNEDDGRVAGAHLVVGDASAVGSSDPFSHPPEPTRPTGAWYRAKGDRASADVRAGPGALSSRGRCIGTLRRCASFRRRWRRRVG